MKTIQKDIVKFNRNGRARKVGQSTVTVRNRRVVKPKLNHKAVSIRRNGAHR